MIDDKTEAQILEKLTCIRDNNGRPALMLGFVATVYFENGYTRPKREAVTELTEQYMRQFKDELQWSVEPGTAQPYPISSGKVKPPSEWLPQHEDGVEWWLGYYGGDHKEGAASFQVAAFSADNVRPGPGYFSIHLPLDYFGTHGGTLAEFLRPICERLKPISGYAGLGLLQPLDILAGGPGQALVRTLGERFPGFEIEARPVTCNHVGKGIKGINWLTILSDRWIEEMGGLDYLRIRLDEPTFPFHRYDGGVIIQAGAKPQIGDATKDLWPAPYITLTKVLKKIQIKEHYAFHVRMSKGQIMDRDATLAWLFRFDGK